MPRRQRPPAPTGATFSRRHARTTTSCRSPLTAFETTVVNDVHVEVLKAYTVNAVLKVGSTTQTVVVTEEATAELQTSSATVGAVLGGESLNTLPVFTRSASALMFYQPGVTPTV